MQMTNFCDVTEDQVKAEFESNPACNQTMTWEEVKSYEPMYNILKMQTVQHLNGEQHTTEETQVDKNRRLCGLPAEPKLTVVKNTTPVKQIQPAKKSSVVFLGPSRIQQLLSAINLSRNCLQSPAVNSALRDEAIRELSQFIQFLKQKSQ